MAAEPIDVSASLAAHSSLGGAAVEKEDDLAYDLGSLYCLDAHPADAAAWAAQGQEAALAARARDNAQLLLNRVFQLPSERVAGSEVLALLPPPAAPVPREKPLPAAKRETKWEAFARAKGIQKRKRGRMELDEETQEYRPRWGYRRANDELAAWAVEDRPSEVGMHEDPFAKRKADKRERVRKQQKQQVRNAGRASAAQAGPYDKFLSAGLQTSVEKSKVRKKELNEELAHARLSTASQGKFDPLLAKEKPLKRSKQKKRPVSSDGKAERSKNLSLVEKVLKKSGGT
mmetsp:Transcript_17498/g.67870  ORF Transcript_17498/g.67870 Transcript_17498/m.67870 type:complete len:288 (+) Transcript_17498:41-904(+)